MRTTLRLAAASVAAASLVGTATAATAEPSPSPVAAPQPGTGSSAVDSGSAAARSAVDFLQHGDIIGIIVLLGVTPFQMLTGGICDLATLSALPNPCRPMAPRYATTSPVAN
ncbi:hypothetical protein APR12_000455 [Nocardia amikacinitolerans]|uniref:hypothetical protein n=1 Tax=Nocardia amikacinitolerans TaxID=756689 RepID=UPI000829C6F3|nr:hypothetical protein [Nocardia amikacinitolerans]MCP2315125.1 hypothetical protein [Nocardia amikacinitolerans]